MILVDEKRPFPARCAVLYCFQATFHHNPALQQRLINSILPHNDTKVCLSLVVSRACRLILRLLPMLQPITASGLLLIRGLMGKAPLTVWFVSLAFSHGLLGNAECKEMLMRSALRKSDTSELLVSRCVTQLNTATEVGCVSFFHSTRR
jgi:hypothetical protein